MNLGVHYLPTIIRPVHCWGRNFYSRWRRRIAYPADGGRSTRSTRSTSAAQPQRLLSSPSSLWTLRSRPPRGHERGGGGGA